MNRKTKPRKQTPVYNDNGVVIGKMRYEGSWDYRKLAKEILLFHGLPKDAIEHYKSPSAKELVSDYKNFLKDRKKIKEVKESPPSPDFTLFIRDRSLSIGQVFLLLKDC